MRERDPLGPVQERTGVDTLPIVGSKGRLLGTRPLTRRRRIRDLRGRRLSRNRDGCRVRPTEGPSSLWWRGGDV